MSLVEQVIQAYGGHERWQNATRIEAEFSAKGWAFTLKRRKAFERVKLELELQHPVCSINPINASKGLKGQLIGGETHLINGINLIVAQRLRSRRYFPYGRRLFWWDDLDMTYFTGYAMWNYLTLPRLLMNPAIQWKEVASGQLEADFPTAIPTHSSKQQFIFDTTTFLLKQHNYTVDIISPLATAANVVTSHTLFDGIPVASKRLVTPMRKDGSARGAPVLIDLEIHDFRLF